MVKELDMKHYIKKIIEHEEKRLSTNDRQSYWQRYNEGKEDENR